MREQLKSIPHREAEEWLHKRTSEREKGMRIFYEGEFVEKFVLKPVSEYLKSMLTPEDARVALLAESTESRRDGIASGSPASEDKHIFSKAVGVAVEDIKKLWWDGKEEPVSQSGPDWAVRAPCPHTVVFEAKLFRDGGIESAKSELVQGIYQCFYYRAHPRRPNWDYDYACLFAYDLSKSGSLMDACRSLSRSVIDSCGNSSNIFLMVLREGTATPEYLV
jgi:hypothetical protein